MAALRLLAMVRGTQLLMNNCQMQVSQYAEQMGLVWKAMPFDFPTVEYFLAWHPTHRSYGMMKS